MGEDSIKTAEEQLHTLITDANNVLIKLKKTLTIFLYVGIPIIAMFFYSFVDVRLRIGSVEDTKLSLTDADAKYATKSSVVFLQNDIYDMNNTMYQYRMGMTEQRMESYYTKALKAFMGDLSRSSTTNQQ